MNRRDFLGLSTAALAALSVKGWVGVFHQLDTVAQDHPNVLFIAIDDLNDWIGCLGGHPDAQTPNLDRLAERGMLFTNAHCTAPLCNPSRASLMTGIHPSTSGVYENTDEFRESPVLQNAATIPQHFMAHGYNAVGGGKIFHGIDAASWNDRFPSFTRVRPGDPKPPNRPVNGIPDAQNFDWGPVDEPDSEMGDFKTADWAIGQLGEQHDSPFFIGCGFFRPHLPWYVPRKYIDMYPLESITLPVVNENDLDDIPPIGRSWVRTRDNNRVMEHNQWRQAVQGYLASISFVDSCVGRVLDALDASPYADSTVIVLWSDHGWHLGEKLHWRKFALWEEATHNVLMVVAPGITQSNQRCARPVSMVDIYPTLIELCGLNAKAELEGQSLLPLLQNPEAAWDRPALTTYHEGNHSLRSDRYRYIRYNDGTEELYDHENDELEWENLADDPAYAEIKAALAVWLPAGTVPPLAADFFADKTTSATGSPVQFTDLSTGSPTSWTWDFGDGGSSNEQNPSHTYDTVGQYTVALTAAGIGGSDTETKADYINVTVPPPVQTFEPLADSWTHSGKTSKNSGASSILKVKEASSSFETFLKFDVQSVSGPVVNATLRLYVTSAPASGGAGTAHVVADNSWTEDGITWSNAPAMGQELGSSGPVQVGQWATFDVTSAVSGSGLVSLGVRSTDGDLIAYSSKEGSNAPQLVVEVQTGPPQPPIADFAANVTDVFTGEEVQFSDLSSNYPTSWEWDFGDGGSSNSQNPSHVYTAVGLYEVSLTATNDQGSDMETKVDYINVTAAPPLQTFEPLADAWIHSGKTSKNTGGNSILKTKAASSDIESYLKFDVQGVAGAVQTATLRLYVTSAPASGASGTAYVVTDNNWTEDGITWSNAPGMSQALGSSGPVQVGQWAELDVTAAVTGDGLVSLGVRSTDGDLITYSSKEGSSAPQLVVEWSGGQTTQLEVQRRPK